MQVELNPAEATEIRAALRARVLFLRGSSSDHKPTREEYQRRQNLIEALLERISPATNRKGKA